jgi:hypothetical protein
MSAKTKGKRVIHVFQPTPDVEAALKREVVKRAGGSRGYRRGIRTAIINEALRNCLIA